MFSKTGSFQLRLYTATQAALVAVAALIPAASLAADKSLVNIKQVQVSENDRVDILLDGKLDPSQIRTEFLNDIVQLSVSDASVYPAKISSVSGRDLSKIFIYQYAPRLVRVRLTVKGKAETFQGKVQVKPSGKMLTIRLDGGAATDKVASSAAQAKKEAAPASAVNVDAEERALLEKVLKAPVAKAAEPVGEKAAAAETPATDGVSQKSSKRRESKGEPLTGRKESFSPVRMLVSLLGVVLLLGAGLLGLKKLASSRNRQGAVGRWVRKSLGRPEKMIEVVATHHLGPKKSIHMVKVAGRTLVLGVADDSINLITELNGASAASISSQAPAGAASGGDEDFLSALGEQIAQDSGRTPVPGMAAGATAAGPASYHAPRPAPAAGTRDRIRSRLEGMKQL
jgi:flagellar biogenesis protein FliO